MKKIVFNFLLISSIILVFNGCKKDKDEPTPTNSNTPTVQANIPVQYAKKWYVNNSKSINAVEYMWIEFTTSGNYFILFDDGTAKSGQCHYSSSDNKIILDGYGYVEIITIDSNNFSFNLHIDATSETTTIFTTVGSQTVTGTNANLLCKTWKVTEYYMVNLSTNDTTYQRPNPSITYSRFDVNFTSYGTYFTSEEYVYNGTPGTLYDNRYWKFFDGNENKLCYGLTQEQSNSCEYTCNITTLTTNLLIVEGTQETVYGTYYSYVKCVAN